MIKNLSQMALLFALIFAFQVNTSSFALAKDKNDKHHDKKNNDKDKDQDPTPKKKNKGAKALDKRMARGYGLLGFRLGMNLHSLSMSKEKGDALLSDTGMGFGVSAGVTIDKAIPNNDFVGIRVEALFQQKAFDHQSPTGYKKDAKKVDTSTTLNFIEIPVLVTLRFNKGQKIRPIGYFGGFVGALIAASGQQDGGTNPDARMPFKTFDYGMVLGGGANIYLGKGAGLLSVELRYARGFANLADGNMLESTLKSHNFDKDPLSTSIYNTNNVTLLLTYHL
jgi:hypothetical protein